MTRAVLAALLSHWRRQPVQLAALLVGLALATALWSGVQAINAEARASYDRAAGLLGQDRLPALTSPRGAIALATYVRLRRAGWRLTPLLEGEVEIAGQSYRVTGIDYLSAAAEGLPKAAASPPDEAALLTAPGIVFAAPRTVAALKGAGAALPPRVAARNLPPGRLVTDIGAAERLLGRNGELTRLLIRAEQPMGRAPLDEVAPGLVRRAPQSRADLAQLTDSFHLNLTAFGLLSFAVGLFIVHGAVGLAFEQRRPVIRTLRALGVPAGRLMGLLLGELLVLALVAGAAGLVLGYLIAALLLPGVAATLDGLYGTGVPGSLTLRPGWAAAGLGMALAGTLVAAADALWRVRRLPLLATAQPRAWLRASAATLRWQGAAALALALAGAVLASLADGLLTGFGVLAALLLAAALALPPVLAAGLALGARLSRGRPLAEWFWADTRQQLPGLSLALMALLLALAANIGVGTMVASFRQTFTGFLDQRLAAELYLRADSEEQAARLAPWLAARTDAVLPIRSTERELAGRPGSITGFRDDPTYRDNWPLLKAVPDAWGRVAGGEAVLVNEQLYRLGGVDLGDSLRLGPGWRLPVAGIYSDYGTPEAEAMVALSALDAHLAGGRARRFALRLPEDRVAPLREALARGFGLTGDAVIDQGALKALSLRVFDRTFAVTGALNILTLAVAGIAILTSLATLSGMRLPQLAPVWAAGITRARLARLELLRSLTLAAMTALLALPVGLLLARVLLDVVNVAAFGWRLPMHLFPADWLRLGGLALLAAALATALPIRRLARTPPAAFLKVFANER